jgi:hypothetical protein
MTRYYTLNSATLDLERLVPPIAIGGRNLLHLTPAQAAALDPPAYPRELDEEPTPPEGKLVEPDGWELRDGAWHRRWRYVDAPLPTLAEYDAAMEDHLVQERSARGYTTREPTAYLASGNARWASDARDWVAHVDAVMAYALDLINAVQSGQREAPTMAEFRAGLPTITWSYQEGE